MAEARITDNAPGFIYFIRAGRTSSIKIGYAKNPYKRIDGMQVSSPHPLYLIGYYPGDMNDEFDWHRRWRHLHVRGEWFRLGNDLRWAINSKLNEPGAVRYIQISSGWRELRNRQSQFHQPKRPAFIDRPDSKGGTKCGTSRKV